MPGFDRTGPRGEGPRTGWAMGKCNPGKTESGENKEQNISQNEATPEEDLAGESGRGTGRGFGWGPGRGTGRGIGRGPGRGLGRGLGRGPGRGGHRWRGGNR